MLDQNCIKAILLIRNKNTYTAIVQSGNKKI